MSRFKFHIFWHETKKKLCKLWHIPLHILHLTWTISCVKCYPPIGPRAIRGNWWFKNILILFYHNILERMCDISYFVQANLLLSKLSPAQSQGSLFGQLEKKKNWFKLSQTHWLKFSCSKHSLLWMLRHGNSHRQHSSGPEKIWFVYIFWINIIF